MTTDRSSDGPPLNSKATAIWLTAVAAIILAMVVVGGATRATGSGLSITQWKPVSGIIPPLNHGDWEHLFALYKTTPQYHLVNQGMNLSEFKSIFWWEWSHRLLGRLLGFVFFVPFLALVAMRRLPRRLFARCLALFVLGGVQGLVGWWMVKSGLEFRTSVAPERLAVHLGLALLLFSASIWTALDAWFGPGEPRRTGLTVQSSMAYLAAIYIQCLLGALVAGNHAGLTNADWPLMDGRLIPNDYWQGDLWTTIVHGLAATQFDHRLWAYALVVSGIAIAVGSIRRGGRALRLLALALLGLLTIQVGLGIATLLLTVPLPLALAHQFTAALILTVATAFAWINRRKDLVSKYRST